MEENILEEITFRELEESDYEKGYFELLQHLTDCRKSSKDEFAEQLRQIKATGMTEIIVGVYKNRIISNITLIYEKKFIRNLGTVCHVEDFVIHPELQKMKLGTTICQLIKQKAKEANCYKIILDCSEEVKAFYIKQGFIKKSEGMALYFDK